MSTIEGSEDLSHELAMLASRVDAMERRLGQKNGSVDASFDLAAVMADVRQISQELFPGPCEFTSEFDPEYPEDRYVVVNVEATGDLKEIVDRGELWHERIRQLSENLTGGNLRLSIVPR